MIGEGKGSVAISSRSSHKMTGLYMINLQLKSSGRDWECAIRTQATQECGYNPGKKC